MAIILYVNDHCFKQQPTDNTAILTKQQLTVTTMLMPQLVQIPIKKQKK